MKTVTTLTLENGKEIEIEFINSAARAGNQIIIELLDARPLSEIAADFEGCQTIRKTDSIRPGVTEMYEGYAELIDIRRNQIDSSVRSTLKKA